jgi:four helix bundle protein
MEHGTYSPSRIDFHKKLKKLMDEYAFKIYEITKEFPKDEIYGLTSQLRRAGLSIILNYIEGYARRKKLVYKNFLEISYGSLKETKYLIYFSLKQEYLKKEKYQELDRLGEEIGAMLWGIMRRM